MFSRIKQKIARTFLAPKSDQISQTSNPNASKFSRRSKSVESLHHYTDENLSSSSKDFCEKQNGIIDESKNGPKSYRTRNKAEKAAHNQQLTGNKFTSTDGGNQRKSADKEKLREQTRDLKKDVTKLSEEVNNFRKERRERRIREIQEDEEKHINARNISPCVNELKSSAPESNSNYSIYSKNQGKVNKLAQLRQQKLDNLCALREGVIYEENSRGSQYLEKSGSQTEMVNSSGDFMIENLADLEKKFLSSKLKQYIFCYNECANRHWSWSKLPLDQKPEASEPFWDEGWQPTQPQIAQILVHSVRQHSCYNENVNNNINDSSPVKPKRKLHSISRLFNFYENTLDDTAEDVSAADQIDAVNVSVNIDIVASSKNDDVMSSNNGVVTSPKIETITSSKTDVASSKADVMTSENEALIEPKDNSHHAMERIQGLPWEENVMDGSYDHRRNICMFQVEFLVTSTDTYPSSDEQLMKKREERRRLARVSRRKSTIIGEKEMSDHIRLSHDTDEVDSPIVEPENLTAGNVARLKAEFKKNSEQIANSLVADSKTASPKRGAGEGVKKVEHHEKVSLVFKGNGKFGTILKAGQTGAANEDTLSFQGSPVDIVAMREFYVEVSLLYLFSEETLNETEIEVKSEGQKEVEELGMSAFSSNKVSQLVARYAEQKGDTPDWMRHTKADSTTSGAKRTHSEDDIVDLQQKMQLNNKRRQEEERVKCVWTSRMRHFRDSIKELLAAKFLPDAIVAVCPEDTDCKTLEKYLKIEIKSCANIVNGLPSNWPNLERVFIVPFSRKKVTEFQVGMNNLVFNV